MQLIRKSRVYMSNSQHKRKVLLSIKPEYVKEIINGNKIYEFRKIVFDDINIEKVFIYATSPVKKIVADFEVGEIIAGTPEEIWQKCHLYAGIEERAYRNYFVDREKAFAILIKKLNVYKSPIDPYRVFNKFHPPQSYMFFDNQLESSLRESLSD